jgi:hypothetical protein
MSGKRLNRASKAAAVVVLAVAAGAWFCPLGAGEKVRFSDSKQSPTMPEADKKDRSGSFGGLLDKDNSLGGVTAIPFSSVYAPAGRAAAKNLTPRERDLLDQHNNWIQLTPDDVALTEKSAAEAFGVRGFSLEDFQDQRQRRRGDLQRYVDKMDQKSRKEQEKAEADSPGKGFLSFLGSELTKPEKGESAREGTATSRARQAMGLELLAVGSWTRLDDEWFGRSQGSLADSLVGSGVSELFKGGLRAPRWNRFQLDRAEAAAKKPAADLGADALANPLVGALDPVNLQPDLTRQQLNPVVGQPINQAKEAATVNLSEFLRPLGPAALLTRPTVTDGLSLGGVGVSPITPTPILPAGPRKADFSPARFEIPKRPY